MQDSASPFTSVDRSIDVDALFSAPDDDGLRRKFEPMAAAFLEAHAAGEAERLATLRLLAADLEPGPIVVSTFNRDYSILLSNWASSCYEHGIECQAFTLLFPTDRAADEHARSLGFKTYFDGVSYGVQSAAAHGAFGDEDFRRFLFAKLATTRDALMAGRDVLRQDVDVVWLRDPRRYLTKRMASEGLDFLFMYDGPSHMHAPLNFNTGFVQIRNTPAAHSAWEMLFRGCATVMRVGGEQRVLNALFNVLNREGLRCGRLEENVFTNGHAISRLLLEGGTGALPASSAVIHASWTANIHDKIAHLKQFGHWYLD